MSHLQQLMVTVGLVDKVTKPIQGINQQIKQTGELGRQSMDRIVGGVAGLVASGAALHAALQPAIEMDDSLAEVKSLGVVQKDLDLLRQTARHFSVEFGESATDFVKSAYDIKSAMGAMSGKELAGITHASAVLAKATKADAATVTSYMGTMYSIFKDQAEAMGKDNFAAMIAGQTAQAVETFKTSGAEMSAAFGSLGSSAAAMGVSVTEQLGVLGTLQGTMGGARAGTQYTAFIDGAISAQKKLGMSFQDSRGKLLPMVQILGKLKDKVGDMGEADQYKMLKDAFGSTQAVKLIQNLLPDIDGLAVSINNVGQQTGMDKATQMAQDMTSQFDRLTKAFWAVREGAGNSILPTVIDMTAAMADNVALVAEWTQMFPHLTQAVTSVIVGFAAFVALGSAIKILMGVSAFVLGGYSIAWGLLSKVMVGMKAILVWMRGAFLALNIVMAANPAILIIGVLILLGIAMLWMIKNWDLVKTALLDNAFVQMLISGFESLRSGWHSFMNMLGNLNPIDMLGSAIDWLIDKLNMIPGINIKTSGAMPEAAKVTQEVSRSYSGAPVEKSNLAGALSPGQDSINQRLSAARTPDAIKSPAAPLMPQMAAVASQNAGKTVQFGDVHIKNEQGMDPAAMAEWEELQHGF